MTTTPPDQRVSVQEAARRAGVSPGTLRRWVRQGLIPQYGGDWTKSALGHARVVARLRERGHSLEDIRRAQADGRLAFGYIEELFPQDDVTYTLRDAALETQLEPALIERVITALGWSPAQTESITPAGHMEADLDGAADDLGRMRVVIAFADLAGHTRLTEEEGELTAVDAVERFVEAVETTLPDDARVIKTIGARS